MTTATEECTVDHVVRALNNRKSAGPTSLAQIQTALPKHLRKCEGALEAALSGGQIWKYGRVRNSDQFWTESPQHYAARVIESKLRQSSDGATETVLIKAVSTALLEGILVPREVIAALVSQGRIFVQPKLKNTKGVKYTLDPYDFVDRLMTELADKLNRIAAENQLDPATAIIRARTHLPEPADSPTPRATQWEQSHEPPEAAAPSVVIEEPQSIDDVALSDAEAGELILQSMRDMNPRADEGDPLVIPELRQRLDFHLEKSEFDRILLGLFVARRVVLSKVSAGLVSDAERTSFVADEEGNFYNTVAYWKD